MYLPKHFEETRVEVLHRCIRAHPLATLVVGVGDALTADHVPLMLQADCAPPGKLLGHVARANPLWRAAATGIECLAIFHGPQHYVSPNWYATKARTGKAVPTWNYEVVHVHGTLRSIDDAGWLRAFLETLTHEHESGLERPWRIDDAPAEYIERMLGAVVGIELAVARIVGKSKLSQNQPIENRRSLVAALHERGDAASHDMADAIVGREASGPDSSASER